MGDADRKIWERLVSWYNESGILVIGIVIWMGKLLFEVEMDVGEVRVEAFIQRLTANMLRLITS